jgi:CRP-like cAMP-binding protein
MNPTEILLKKLENHSHLDREDKAHVRRLSCQFRELSPGNDFIRQGDTPRQSAIVVAGMLARYHTRPSGGRQYLSLHVSGDWPDAQGLFLEHMDHAVCAVGMASLCTIPHAELISAFRARPMIGFAVWRETLIDAAIFREAITNNSSRDGVQRLAHLFSEIFHRSKAVDLVEHDKCHFPMTQTQLGEMLGMSIATVNRHLQSLRKSGAADFRVGELVVTDPEKLASIGEFDPLYLHGSVQPDL